MERSTFGRPALLSRLFPRRRDDVELAPGDELIDSSSDAAVSSSGVQLGETVGDTLGAFVDMRRRGMLMRIRAASLDAPGEGSGCAGPGSVSAGGAEEASESGTRKEPESGGVGRCEGGPFGFGEGSALRQLGST